MENEAAYKTRCVPCGPHRVNRALSIEEVMVRKQEHSYMNILMKLLDLLDDHFELEAVTTSPVLMLGGKDGVCLCVCVDVCVCVCVCVYCCVCV